MPILSFKTHLSPLKSKDTNLCPPDFSGGGGEGGEGGGGGEAALSVTLGSLCNKKFKSTRKQLKLQTLNRKATNKNDGDLLEMF